MRKLKNDLTGKTFGRLTAIGVDDSPSRKTYFICQCSCGNIARVRSDILIEGKTQSCGCLKKEQDRTNLTANHSHLQSGTRIYDIWQGMKNRCHNKNNARFDRYGGRGISVCDEWRNSFASFYNWALINGYDESLTIDRVNNNGNYEPSNCKWSTMEQQCNNRESNINITIGNATKTLTQWCEIFNLNVPMVHARYNRSGFIGIDDLFSPDRYGR